jgi:multimeric flavodoxin WrbA
MSNTSARIAVAYHSGYGHTAKQAEAVAAGASSVPGAVAELVPLDELTEDVWDRLAAADAIVFGAPTYMGSPSAVFKKFAEESVRAWADDLAWRDKIAAGFTNSKAMSGDKLNSLVDLAVFAAQHGMIWVGLDLYPGAPRASRISTGSAAGSARWRSPTPTCPRRRRRRRQICGPPRRSGSESRP